MDSSSSTTVMPPTALLLFPGTLHCSLFCDDQKTSFSKCEICPDLTLLGFQSHLTHSPTPFLPFTLQGRLTPGHGRLTPGHGQALGLHARPHRPTLIPAPFRLPAETTGVSLQLADARELFPN